MKTLSDNSIELFNLKQKRNKCSRNTVKYNAYTELIRVNKMERKLIIEEEAVTRQNDKLLARTERLQQWQRLHADLLALTRTKLEKYINIQ